MTTTLLQPSHPGLVPVCAHCHPAPRIWRHHHSCCAMHVRDSAAGTAIIEKSSLPQFPTSSTCKGASCRQHLGDQQGAGWVNRRECRGSSPGGEAGFSGRNALPPGHGPLPLRAPPPLLPPTAGSAASQ